MLLRIVDNTISGKIAKQVFEAMWAGEGSADQIIEARGLKQITDSGAIEAVVDKSWRPTRNRSPITATRMRRSDRKCSASLSAR